METNLKIVGFANQSINGIPITNKGVHINYDGNDADINAYDDGKLYYMHLDNEDIKHLLNVPVSEHSLESRLLTDFPHHNMHRTPMPYPRIEYIPVRKLPRKSRRKSRRTSSRRASIRKTPRQKSSSRRKLKTRTPSIDRTIY